MPWPLITDTAPLEGLMMIGTSPPNEKCENSITDAASIAAQPASVALPPC